MKNLKKFKITPKPVFDDLTGRQLKEWCTIRIMTTDQSHRYRGSGLPWRNNYSVRTSVKNFKKIMDQITESIQGNFEEEVLAGRAYGLLTAIGFARKDNFGHNIWLFMCKCGKKKEIDINKVKSGRTLSCGHLKGK